MNKVIGKSQLTRERPKTLKERFQALPTGVRQFIKFCIVGSLNTALDWVIAFLLIYYTAWPLKMASSLQATLGLAFEPKDIRNLLVKFISSGIATCNSFIWNRRWTFRVKGKEGRHRQFVQFVLVSISGMIWNSIITALILRPFPEKPPRFVFLAAQAVATAIVVFWNFNVNRYWTFRTAGEISLESGDSSYKKNQEVRKC